jgi:hypothetical protein
MTFKNVSQIFFKSYKIFEKQRFKSLLMITKLIAIMGHHGHTRPDERLDTLASILLGPRHTKDEHGPGVLHGDQLGAGT